MDHKHMKFLILGGLGLFTVWDLLTPIVFAVLLAVLAYPLFRQLKPVIGNLGSAITTTITLILITAYPLVLGIQVLISNVKLASPTISNAVAQSVGTTNTIGRFLSSGFPEKIATGAFNWFSGVLLASPEILLRFTVLFLLVFYILKDLDDFKAYVQHLAKQTKSESIIEDAESLLKSVIIGYIGTGMIIGTISGIGFFILGFEFWLLLGVVTGLGALIPLLGIWIVYAPIIVFEFLTADYFLMGVVAALAISVQLVEMYAGPKITSATTKVHPAIMMLGFIGGPLAFGFKGFILGPVLLGLLKIFLDNYKSEK